MSQATRILLALGIGLVAGIASAAIGGGWVAGAASLADPIGHMWLAALQMTIVPLVVALLVTGIAATAEAAKASRLAARALIAINVLLWLSAILGMLLTPLLLDLFPLPGASAAALRDALAGGGAVGKVPTFADFLQSIVPTNVITAAASDAFLPLILFTIVFAFAVTRLEQAARERLTLFFKAIADVMLVMIGWVLWLAPIGVFALAYVVGARGGSAAFGALLHYVLIVAAVGLVVLLAAYFVAAFGARYGIAQFTRTVAPAQAVAISTQSSLATLPAMLNVTSALGVPVAAAGVVLPLAVAIYRATGPAMNVAAAVYIARWYGIEISPSQAIAGIVVASTTTLSTVSLPGQVSFFASIGPIAVAMGIPLAPLGLLIAVEVLPDLVRTVGNVTMDTALAGAVARWSGFSPADASEEDKLLAS